MEKFKKVYVWLSGILVAFLATYLTAVLTTVVPPPKDLLCKAKLGFCPAPIILTFSATDTDRIVDRDGVGQGPGEQQIGMLHNRVVPDASERRNSVTYQVNDLPAGNYRLRVLYAAASSRPVDILVNNEIVQEGALHEPTGGWNNDDRRWSPSIEVKLKEGANRILLRRESVFPHLSKIELTQVANE